jgi:hypothetical protein
MKRAGRHDESRLRARRQRVAYEAARLIAQHGLQDYHLAKLKAAQALGISDDASLPRNAEVQEQLRDYQRLFQGDAQPRELRLRRDAALSAMQFFERFEPRLVGSVLDGTADTHSPVNLQVFSDDPDAVARFMFEAKPQAKLRECKLRVGRELQRNFPAWEFSVDGLAFEIVVLPTALLRQPPLSAVDGKPMQRASLAALRQMLADQGES